VTDTDDLVTDTDDRLSIEPSPRSANCLALGSWRSKSGPPPHERARDYLSDHNTLTVLKALAAEPQATRIGTRH